MSKFKKILPAELSAVGDALDFIEDTLTGLKYKTTQIREAMLLTEESMVRLLDNAPKGSAFHIKIKKARWSTSITVSVPGEEMITGSDSGFAIDAGNLGPGNESAIRSILLNAFEDKIRYVRKGDYNTVKVTVGSPELVLAIQSALALVLAIVFGFLLVGSGSNGLAMGLEQYLFQPIDRIFLHMMMLATAPAVFFSVVVAVAKCASFSDPGRIGTGTFIYCAGTSVIAIIIGDIMFDTFEPGEAGALVNTMVEAGKTTPANQLSIIDTLVNIVPTNIVDPFQTSDMLQLLFMAVICGIALGRIGDYSATLQNVIDSLNMLLTTVIGILLNFIPIATFASTVSMIINAGGRVLISVAQMMGVLLLGVLLMFVLYGLNILLIARTNPIAHSRAYFKYMRGTAVFESEYSILNKLMRYSRNGLKLSPKVYNFTIPFGSMFNMDGNCLYLTIAGLFLAKMCGVEIFSSDILPMIFTIFILSIGAPITPGSAIIALGVLLNQMGGSIAAVSIIFGVNTAMELILKAMNAYGNIVAAVTVNEAERFYEKGIKEKIQ